MPQLPEGTVLTVGKHQVTVQQFLLAGGFSQIYCVAMDPPEQGSSIGCLKQVIVNDKAGLATLRKEVDVMKTLRDARCVVRYYDSHAERLADGKYQVLVLMELCPNKSLLEYMNARIRTKLGEPEILDIMRDIAMALYEMHRRQLVHRDIKIENVLIGQTAGGGHEGQLGRFKLADFGLVARPTPVPSDPVLLLQLGHDLLYQTTPQYRAPEMVDLYRGVPIDERADMWALGCFLYKLCYYTTPFEAQGDVAILHAAYGFPPAPPYSGDLKNLIVIMLQENAAYRPNIVQILMLLARMRGEDFALWKVDDFYGVGEYNFHALHEMQRLAHQARQAAQQAEQTKSRRERPDQIEGAGGDWPEAHDRSESRPKDTLTSDQETNIKAGPNQPHSAISSNPEAATPTATDPQADLSNRDPLNSPIDLSGSLNLPPVSEPTESGDFKANDSDEDLDLGELALEDAEVRYPSLDELEIPVALSSTSERAKSYDSIQSLNGKLNSAQTVSHRESVAKLDQDTEQLENSGKVDMPAKPKEAKPSAFEDPDAWKRLARSPLDKDAKRLAEAIFVSQSSAGKNRSLEPATNVASPATPQFVDDGRRTLSGRVSRVSLGAIHTELEKLSVSDREAEGSLTRDSLMSDLKYKSKQPEKHGDILREALDTESSRERIPSIPFPLESTEIGSAGFKHDSVQTYGGTLALIVKGDSSNPWGNALSPASEPKLHVSVPALNLIDLDGTQNETRGSHQPSPLVSAAPHHEEISLLDIDLDATRDVVTRPVFKNKRDILNQPFAFQEEVIDFASDDENTNSEMSRVAIRDSLKRPKGRKSADHRRSDSTHSKRRLFFGE